MHYPNNAVLNQDLRRWSFLLIGKIREALEFSRESQITDLWLPLGLENVVIKLAI